MKQFKLFVWIAVLMILSTVLSVYFNNYGIVPDLFFAFTIAYAAHERNLTSVIWVTLICAVIASAITAGVFWLVVLTFTYAAALTYMSYDRTRRMSGIWRTIAAAALFSAAGGCAAQLIESLSFDVNYFLFSVLPETVLNTVCAAVIYLLVNKCFGIKDTTKKLIIS